MQPSPPPVSSDQAAFVSQGGADGPNDEIDLRELLAVLAAGKWTIALIAAVVLALGLAYAMTSTPIYQANALVQVESTTNSVLDELQSLSALTGNESPGQTEIQILKSRYVAGQVVDQLVLDIKAMPRYFPIIGRSIAARPDGAPGELAAPWFGLDRYAWGGEVLTVKRMKVPSEWTGEPDAEEQAAV